MASFPASVEQLSPKQEKALSVLIVEPTVTKAAEMAGCSERSLYRWINDDPVFGRAYRELRRQVMGEAVAQLQRVSGLAAATLSGVMLDDEAAAAAKVSAARTVLEYALRATEGEELESRLEELELIAKGGGAR